jgi:hypothetical protein
MVSEQLENVAKVVLAREEWLDYVFGICKPDRRIGKQGSRCESFKDMLLPLRRPLLTSPAEATG